MLWTSDNIIGLPLQQSREPSSIQSICLLVYFLAHGNILEVYELSVSNLNRTTAKLLRLTRTKAVKTIERNVHKTLIIQYKFTSVDPQREETHRRLNITHEI